MTTASASNVTAAKLQIGRSSHCTNWDKSTTKCKAMLDAPFKTLGYIPEGRVTNENS